MKTKALVKLSSVLVLTILVVCVSVYAFNAYCTASESACRATGSVNGHGLFNGAYSVTANVDGDFERKANNFANGALVSVSAVKDLADGDCDDGGATASISGWDANGQHHAKWDDANF